MNCCPKLLVAVFTACDAGSTFKRLKGKRLLACLATLEAL